jgi:uncharacterized protein
MNKQSIVGVLVMGSIVVCAACNIAPINTSVPIKSPKIQKIVVNAIEQTKITHSYNPAYVQLAYPGGDVPMSTGVCTDVVVRAYRAADIDFQQKVHQDMQRNFTVYPHNWGGKAPDANIDHRRVPNLMTFLQRRGKAVPRFALN